MTTLSSSSSTPTDRPSTSKTSDVSTHIHTAHTNTNRPLVPSGAEVLMHQSNPLCIWGQPIDRHSWLVRACFFFQRFVLLSCDPSYPRPLWYFPTAALYNYRVFLKGFISPTPLWNIAPASSMSYAEKHFDDGIFFAPKLQQEAFLSSSKVLSSSFWVQSRHISGGVIGHGACLPWKGLSFLFHRFSLK